MNEAYLAATPIACYSWRLRNFPAGVASKVMWACSNWHCAANGPYGLARETKSSCVRRCFPISVRAACRLSTKVWHRITDLLVASFLAAASAAPVAAQTIPLQIDENQSYATLWMGRQTEVTPIVNVGVAQVGGNVTLGAPDPSTSALKFGLVPGGGGAELLASDGTVRTGQTAQIARYTVMSFQSNHARVRRDGHVEIAGLLTVTHVTREVVAKPWTWGYSGVSYDDPVSNSVTRPVTFVFVNPSVAAMAAHPTEVVDVLATATTEAGDFPELVDDVLDASWPIVALNEQCVAPPNAGDMRDYVGVLCNGKAITAQVPLNEHHSFAVDYHGMREAVTTTHGPVTIVLHLKLALPAPTPSGR